LYFNFFSASFCTTFLSAGIATSVVLVLLCYCCYYYYYSTPCALWCIVNCHQ